MPTTKESQYLPWPERDSFPRRLTHLLGSATAKEGAHGGTMGSPMQKES
jgi:hypothetical protein